MSWRILKISNVAKLELKSEPIKNHWLNIESKCNETLFKELINMQFLINYKNKGKFILQ